MNEFEKKLIRQKLNEYYGDKYDQEDEDDSENEEPANQEIVLIGRQQAPIQPFNYRELEDLLRRADAEFENGTYDLSTNILDQ